VGVEYKYLSVDKLTLSQLLAFREISRTKYTGFRETLGEDPNHGYFELTKLPALEAFRGIELKEIRTEGHLPVDEDPFHTFRQIFNNDAEKIGESGLLIIRCGFEEKSSIQSKRGYDTVSIKLEKGKMFFGYSANGSNVDKKIDYRKEFIRRVLEVTHIPVTMIEREGYFILEHKLSGDIKILKGGFGGKNPAAFQCEILDGTVDELMIKMEEFLSEFASEKRYKYSWTATCSGSAETEINNKIYDFVVSADFPADKYSLDIEFLIDEISTIETIKNLCGPNDKVFTSFFNFTLPENNSANVQVVTDLNCHHLLLTLTDSEYISEIENIFGTDFKEI